MPDLIRLIYKKDQEITQEITFWSFTCTQTHEFKLEKRAILFSRGSKFSPSLLKYLSYALEAL